MISLLTRFGKEILSGSTVLQGYPRPQLVRDSYVNLNGLWDVDIVKEGEDVDFKRQILVPFSPESSLSGISQFVSPSDVLYYRRNVQFPKSFIGKKVWLHFGAVDQTCEVIVNKELCKTHIGGFTPFSIDITDFCHNQDFTIELKVKDVSDTSYHQTGKQRIERGGIFYISQSGIWQTVWMEALAEGAIEDLTLTPHLDEQSVSIKLYPQSSTPAEIQVFFDGVRVAYAMTKEAEVLLPLSQIHPWSMDKPNLYDVVITRGDDQIKSYFGMRKFEKRKDEHGIQRFYLNNQPILLNGVLDQGYYPDGLLTPPTDEAMITDIQTMKDLGFNFIRKHIKIEPLRWYYHCDKLGIMVWQDFVSGSERKDIFFHGLMANLGIHYPDWLYFAMGRKSKVGRNQFIIEAQETLHHLKNVVSIGTWVPFNEAWGQFDSLKMTKMIRKTDSSRLVDHASGWYDQGGGDFFSRHIYFTKILFPKHRGKRRILALTEFGGYSHMLKDHSMNPEHVFGYRKYETLTSLGDAIEHLYLKEVLPQLQKGLSVLVYTQLSDVEDEVNGFLSYDREVLKVSKERMKRVNEQLYEAFRESL